MALNPSGAISLGGATSGQSINLELGKSATAQASLNDADVRGLAGVASGQISMPGDFWGKSSASNLQNGGFWYKYNGSLFAHSNTVSPTGTVSGDNAISGTARFYPNATSYGSDKGIVYGGRAPAYVGTVNYITNTGSCGGDNNLGLPAKAGAPGCSFGPSRAQGAFIGGFAPPSTTTYVTFSNTGSVSTTGSYSGTATGYGSGGPYGVDKGVVQYGTSPNINIARFVTNTGSIGGDTATSNSVRSQSQTAGFNGSDACVMMGGYVPNPSGGFRTVYNIITNTGSIGSDTSMGSFGRRLGGGCEYGGDKGIIGFGTTQNPGVAQSNSVNYVTNTGSVGGVAAGAGTGGSSMASVGYGV